jgi:hypothetical protein
VPAGETAVSQFSADWQVAPAGTWEIHCRLSDTNINNQLAGDQKKDRLSTFLPAKNYIDLHILKHVQNKFEHKIGIIKEVTIGMPLTIEF